MQLNRIDDPRDLLSKARLPEIIKFANENGIKEIPHNMTAIPARGVIRGKGLVGKFNAWARENIPNRILGHTNQNPQAGMASVPEGEAPSVSLEADALRQWQEQQREPSPIGKKEATPLDPSKPLASFGINELRKECQRLGIKLGRRANMKSMREDIEAHRNGKNAT